MSFLWRRGLAALAACVGIGPAAIHADPITVEGLVRSQDRGPLPGASVELLPKLSNFDVELALLSRRVSAPPLDSATTDSGGRFVLTAPAAGVFTVTVKAEGFVPMRYFLLPLPGPAELPSLTLRPAASTRVTISDASGRALADVPVYARSSASSPGPSWTAGEWEPLSRIGWTDARGRVTLTRARGERLDVAAFVPDSAIPRRQEGIEAEAWMTPAPQALRRKVIELRDAGGAPVADAVVAVSELAWPLGRTDPEGRFVLLLDETTPLQVHFFTEHGRRLLAAVKPASEDDGGISVVELPEPVPVAGRVLGARDGRPVSGALVWPADDPGRFAITGARGDYALVAPAPRSFRVHTEGRGFLPRSATVEVWHLRRRQAPPLELETAAVFYGRVVDGDLRPVAGAEVKLEPAGARTGDATSSAVAVSDDSGRFETPRTAARKLDLRARRKGFAPMVVPGVQVPPGESSVDLGTLILGPGAVLGGTVTDADGLPIAGAEVRVSTDLDPPWPAVAAQVAGQAPDAVTDAEGGFSLEDLPPGRAVRLLVDGQGYLPAVAAFEGPAGETVTVVLEAAAQVSGRVVDALGAGVSGAQVSLRPLGRPEGERTARGRSLSSAADERGNFVLEDAAPGRAAVSAYARGFQPSDETTVELAAKEVREDVEIVLERGAALAGRVTAADGEPVAGARVRAGRAEAATEADGSYRVEGIRPGRREVEVRHPEYNRLSEDLEIEDGEQRADFELSGGRRVAGRVVDADRRPLAGVVVELVGEDPREPRRYRTASDAEGMFAWLRVADGSYRLEAVREGFAPATAGGVEVAGAPVDDVEVEMRRGATIAGRILGLELDELAEVEVDATEGDRDRAGTVDYDGAYRIVDLAPGDWLVVARLRGGSRQAQARVGLAADAGRVTRDLEFGRGFTFTGRVLHGGEALDGAKVTFTGHDVAVRRQVETDLDGRFRVGDLSPGRYRLGLAHRPRTIVYNEDLEISGDDDRLIEIASVRVTGRVISSATSEPLADVLVAMRQLLGAAGDGSLLTAGTDERGIFSFERLSAGRYRLSVRADGYEPAERLLDLPPGAGREDLELALASTAGLDLFVRLASGRTPRFVHLRALDAGGLLAVAETRVADDGGYVRFPTVPAGAWELLVSAPDAAAVRVAAEVPGDPVEVVLPSAGRLEVRVPALLETEEVATVAVADAAGRPFVDVDAGGELRDTWRLVGGRATVPGVPAGVWTLLASSPAGRSWTATVTTTGGPVVEVILE